LLLLNFESQIKMKLKIILIAILLLPMTLVSCSSDEPKKNDVVRPQYRVYKESKELAQGIGYIVEDTDVESIPYPVEEVIYPIYDTYKCEFVYEAHGPLFIYLPADGCSFDFQQSNTEWVLSCLGIKYDSTVGKDYSLLDYYMEAETPAETNCHEDVLTGGYKYLYYADFDINDGWKNISETKEFLTGNYSSFEDISLSMTDRIKVNVKANDSEATRFFMIRIALKDLGWPASMYIKSRLIILVQEGK